MAELKSCVQNIQLEMTSVKIKIKYKMLTEESIAFKSYITNTLLTLIILDSKENDKQLVMQNVKLQDGYC